MPQAQRKQPPVQPRDPPEDRIVPLLRPVTKKEARQRRRQNQREQQRAKQRKSYCQRHGPKEPALHALQREDRQIRSDDDSNREEHRPLYFMRRLSNAGDKREVIPLPVG